MNDYYLVIADAVIGFITCITFMLCLINLVLFKQVNKYCKALSLYIIFCFLFDFSNTVLIYFQYSNVGLLPLFNMVELVLLGTFLHPINPYPKMSKISIGVGVLLHICELVYYFNTNDYILNKGRVFNAILFLTILFSILYRSSNDLKMLPLIHVMIIYFVICFIQFILLEFLVNIPHDSIFITWMLYALAGGVLYSISTYYLWKNIKTSNM